MADDQTEERDVITMDLIAINNMDIDSFYLIRTNDTIKDNDDLDITNEILDGIFSAEDWGEATTEDKDDSSDCDCDCKVSTLNDDSDHETVLLKGSPGRAILVDKEHNSIIQHIVQF